MPLFRAAEPRGAHLNAQDARFKQLSVSFSRILSIQQVTRDDQALMRLLLSMFGKAFDEADTYGRNQPRDGYLQQLLGSDTFIALVALKSGEVSKSKSFEKGEILWGSSLRLAISA